MICDCAFRHCIFSSASSFKGFGTCPGRQQTALESPGVSFGRIAWMIRDGCVAICARVEPNLMTPRSLPIKLDSACPKFSDDIAITKARQTAQLCGHHDRVVVKV